MWLGLLLIYQEMMHLFLRETWGEIRGHGNKKWILACVGQAKVSLFLLCSLQTRRRWKILLESLDLFFLIHTCLPALGLLAHCPMSHYSQTTNGDGDSVSPQKGCGYHLDLLMVAIMLGVCSIMGLPWFVAATVLSITHVNSLKLESECSAPGEQPKFLGIREQRVTGLMIFVLMGCSVFMTAILKVTIHSFIRKILSASFVPGMLLDAGSNSGMPNRHTYK